MSSIRHSSLDPLDMPNWRWGSFLDEAIKALDVFNLEPYPLAKEFLQKDGSIKSKSGTQKVTTCTWACRSKKIRQVRAACVDAGKSASVFNFVVKPFHIYDLPFFGADFVTLPSGHLLALDLQPAMKNDELHTLPVWEKLLPLHQHWQSLLPDGGPIPASAKQYFSPGFLWTRLPLGVNSDNLINEVLKPAFVQYLSLYSAQVHKAREVPEERALLLLEGQKSYLRYRAEKDPARGMLTRFYGSQWTESYIHEVLFEM